MSYDIDPNVDPFEYHPNTRRSLGVIENQAVTTESGRERMNRLQQKTPGWNEPGGSSGEHKPITGLQSSPAQTPMAPQFRSQYTSGQVSYPNPNRSGSANMTYSGKRPTASGSELSLPRSYADVALRTQTVTGYELAMEFAGVQDQRRNNDVSNPHTEGKYTIILVNGSSTNHVFK
ncbi:hypothetical protein FRB93_002991 [Tulasnella sp. JGI-2019a]|nr:hypothetical protein FRB93_002991 [Tulasnella sp. JGI-2019a]